MTTAPVVLGLDAPRVRLFLDGREVPGLTAVDLSDGRFHSIGAEHGSYTAECELTYTDGGAAWRAFTGAPVPTPEQIGCEAAVERWWRRVNRTRAPVILGLTPTPDA